MLPLFVLVPFVAPALLVPFVPPALLVPFVAPALLMPFEGQAVEQLLPRVSATGLPSGSWGPRHDGR